MTLNWGINSPLYLYSPAYFFHKIRKGIITWQGFIYCSMWSNKPLRVCFSFQKLKGVMAQRFPDGRSFGTGRSLNEFGYLSNTTRKYLLKEDVELKDGSKIFPRQVKKVHFTEVLPEPVAAPYPIAASKSCAALLELNLKELSTDAFTQLFSGNKLVAGLDVPYATVYGCHSHGQWFGQLGDGRALSLGEVRTCAAPSSSAAAIAGILQSGMTDVSGSASSVGLQRSLQSQQQQQQQQQLPPLLEAHERGGAAAATTTTTTTTTTAVGSRLYELQLKGCGRSPYSRGFDGRAVVRSSVREFLGK
jgi:hypothetical protein